MIKTFLLCLVFLSSSVEAVALPDQVKVSQPDTQASAKKPSKRISAPIMKFEVGEVPEFKVVKVNGEAKVLLDKNPKGNKEPDNEKSTK